jgi:hypothetical protein
MTQMSAFPFHSANRQAILSKLSDVKPKTEETSYLEKRQQKKKNKNEPSRGSFLEEKKSNYENQFIQGKKKQDRNYQRKYNLFILTFCSVDLGLPSVGLILEQGPS